MASSRSEAKNHALTDDFGRRHTYLRISLTDRCNLRCLYCMPESGVRFKPREEILSLEEIIRLVRLFASLGVKKVRFTGGEPLVRSGIEYLISQVSAISQISSIGITTNGVLLPEKLPALKSAGLTHLNVSLDTLKPDRFAFITRRNLLEKVLEGIELALALGFSALKLNFVVMGGINDDEVLDFVELAREKPLSIRFIEFMPFRANGWSAARFIPISEIKRRTQERYKLIPIPKNGDASAVAKEYIIPGFLGRIGFIGSMSEPFCESCNRLRITADGFLKVCLFSPAKVSLREALRRGASDSEISNLIHSALCLKWYEHPELPELLKLESESMIEVGG